MAASSESSFVLGQGMMYRNFDLTLNTFFFGAYSVLVFLTTRLFLQRGLRATSSRVLFVLSIFMYLIATGFWAYSVAHVVGATQNFIAPTNEDWATFFARVSVPFNLWNAIVLVNFCISDGIVIWRAWVICRRNRRLVLLVPSVFLLFTVLATSGLIVLRTFEVATSPFNSKSPVVFVISVLQLSNMTTSLLSNISATAIIGVEARAHRRAVQYSFKKKTTATQVLFVLLETGLLYCATGVIGILSQLIRLPHGTLNDLLLGVNIQLAGAYAPAILLLVNATTSVTETEAMGTLPTIPTSGAHSTKPHDGLIRVPGRGGKTPVLSVLQFASNPGSSSLGLDETFSSFSPTTETTQSTARSFSHETLRDKHEGLNIDEEKRHRLSDSEYV
ncbi:hypothetical protein HMN09_00751700 [Mycena chlorophos]|uniref:Uncharacterized protein n=1 Tax=Mycena chlorophos TaxID=658473 RepID=A0A8H6W5T8_MYCCL|nr:hypothetical protein HMN09_00751700 [Mycena chlorophos]